MSFRLGFLIKEPNKDMDRWHVRFLMLIILNLFISYKENMLYTLPTMTWEKQLCRLLKMFLYSYTSMFFHINWSAIVSNAKELYLREP